MSESLNVRVAVAEANRVFGRYPLQICLPMVLLGVAGYAAVMAQPSRLILWLALPILFVVSLLQCFMEVVISSIYLRVQDGAEPNTKQASEVLRYRGFASLIGGLLLRCLGWVLFVGVIYFIAAVIFFAIVHTAVGPGWASGIGHLRHGVASGLRTILGTALMSVVLYRYMFVFPMFAMTRVSAPGFLDECVVRTKAVWKTAVLLSLAEIGVFEVHSVIKLLVWGQLAQPHGMGMVADLGMIVVGNCFTAWFILVKTGMALQLMSRPVPVDALDGGIPVGVLPQ